MFPLAGSDCTAAFGLRAVAVATRSLISLARIIAVAAFDRSQSVEANWNNDRNEDISDAIHVLANSTLMSATA